MSIGYGIAARLGGVRGFFAANPTPPGGFFMEVIARKEVVWKPSEKSLPAGCSITQFFS
jgi:hypothetical protein